MSIAASGYGSKGACLPRPGPGHPLGVTAFGQAETLIRVQSVIPTSADEVVMLQDFAADVTALTNGEVRFEVRRRAVVGIKRDDGCRRCGLIEAASPGRISGRASTRQPHPLRLAAAGSGLGSTISPTSPGSSMAAARSSTTSFWDEMGKHQGLLPPARGAGGARLVQGADRETWPTSRASASARPGIPGQIYNEIGVAAVSLGGGEILPAWSAA